MQLIKSKYKDFNEDLELISVMKKAILTYDASKFDQDTSNNPPVAAGENAPPAVGPDEVLYQLPDGFLLNNAKCPNIVFDK